MVRLLIALAALSMLVAPASAQERIKVVATFSILGDLVRQVGGDRIDLTTLVGPDADAHTYQPKPSDARALAAAKAMVSNGLGFEGWATKLANAAPLKGRHIVASAGAATLQQTAHGHGHGHSHAHGPDPHCWQDIACARRYVANIRDGLAAVDAAGAEYYRARTAAYDKRLADLEAWVKAEIAKVPADKRKVISGHEAFRYFAKAYGVQFLAPRGYNTANEPTARDVAALVRLVREQKIKALFVENMTNPGMVEQIARDAGGVVGAKLYSDALSKADGPAASYEAMMRHNVTALVEGMLKN
ncbi:MAG TPA: zinc ABC transporter substrate-binding protein [Reyranellaceae bacterium]|nr:zinc ABC transporter substrate-binding protein [Reyranellaceae bacterium]